MDGVEPAPPMWLSAARDRTLKALAAATAAADRLALLRTLIVYDGGRVDLARCGLNLSKAESALLPRFGLAVSAGGALRLLDTERDLAPAGLSDVLAYDPTDRQVAAPACPDAPLLLASPHDTYRSDAQKAAFRALLTQPPGSGLMISMPTGGGKSLMFQHAALAGRDHDAGACVIVITPTIALAIDHAKTLSEIDGLAESRALTGDTPPAEATAIVDRFRQGKVPILLLSPEKALNPELTAKLVEAASPTSALFGLDARLTHLFVDEAHIVESWGRSFRPDFQRLPGLLSALRAANPELRAVLLSATLSPAARAVLRQGWSGEGPWLEVDAHLPRYEHDVVVAAYPDRAERDAALHAALDRLPRPAIVYTTEIAAADDLHQALRDRGFRRAALFTGDTGSVERKRVLQAWMAEELDLVVATSAFGLGVNKRNVRSVAHACLPEGPARWYQEIGRAARDGGQGWAVCLFTNGGRDSDLACAYDLAITGLLGREKSEWRWEALVKSAEDRGWVDGHRRLALSLDAVREGNFPKSGDHNRAWNRALLTLMQRAEVLRVRSVASQGDEAGHDWDVEILDPRILSTDRTAVWDEVFALRAREIAAARAGLQPFADLMQAPTHACLIQTAFEAIEPDADAAPCGRCPGCRARRKSPPVRLHCGGLEAAWNLPATPLRDLPAGIFLVEPQDPDFDHGLPELIQRLGRVGVDQVVAPRALTQASARALADRGAPMGLVFEADLWTAAATPARRHTAVLLPHAPGAADQVLFALRAAAERWPELTWLVICDPSRPFAGRRLDQTLSAAAPLPEAILDTFAKAAVA